MNKFIVTVESEVLSFDSEKEFSTFDNALEYFDIRVGGILRAFAFIAEEAESEEAYSREEVSKLSFDFEDTYSGGPGAGFFGGEITFTATEDKNSVSPFTAAEVTLSERERSQN